MNKNAETEGFFDRLAPEWDNRDEEYGLRKKLVDMMGIQNNSLIADIGCGKGVMFNNLLETQPRGIIAIDLSGEMVMHAKTLFSDERLMYINGDILGAFLPSFDCALMFNSYPHFKDKKALSDKLSRHVRPGGILVIAHSRSRERINRVHSGLKADGISVPLRSAEEEADEFASYFTLESFVDNEEFFIKMRRKQDS